jgi:colanic acid biosynthesis glycosyl transferase WcaI
LKQSELSHYVIPTKTLAYLASGKAIIMAMHGAAAKLVLDAGAGHVVPPEDPSALAACVKKMVALSISERAAMGRRGKEYLTKNLSRDIVLPRYRQLLERFVATA